MSNPMTCMDCGKFISEQIVGPHKNTIKKCKKCYFNHD